MPRNKKSRKPGAIGATKTPGFSGKIKQKKKNSKGLPSGSRHNIEEKQTKGSSKSQYKDPKHGSKKAIPLTVQPVKKTTYKTPKQELLAIESDSRLVALLDKQERNETLSREQRAYIETKLERHAILCSLLGIDPEEEQNNSDEGDLFDSLDAISLNDFIDSSDKP